MTQTLAALRIAHLDTAVDLRGGQQQLLMLARGLRQQAHKQIIVCPEGSALELCARSEGFPVFPLPSHDPIHAHGILELRRYLQVECYDILHAHDGRGQTISWIASLGMPIQRIASRRVTFMPRSVRSHRLKYTLTCHGVIAVSEYVQHLLAAASVPEAMIEVIPDGVEFPPELPDPQTRSLMRRQWGCGEQEFLIGHVGAFAWEKGQDIAVEAALLLAGRFPQSRLLLAGEALGRWGNLIAAKIRKEQGRVRLLGYVENLAGFFAGLDLFIIPSRAEGFGSSALLAMAYGLPVVASRAGGLPEVVDDGRTGWLVPAGSPSALADAVLAAASDRARLRQFGAKARERAREFSSDIMVRRTEAFYFRILGR